MNNVEEVMATAKCRECGGFMEGRKGSYRYVESGLNSVTINDILVFHCTQCNDVVPEIPAAGVLHRVIAVQILLKKTLLTDSELRFLRKLCGYSINEFSEVIGSSKSVVSRWENGSPHGKGTDRLVRLLVFTKLIRELIGEPQPIMKNVTVQRLNQDLETALKLIEARITNETYEISPEEIAQFGIQEPTTQLSAATSAVN